MLVDWVRLNFGTTVTKSSTSHVGWYPPSTIPHGWWNMMLFWMVKLLWHPVFSDKAVDHWILVTSSWASQPDAANLQELRPQVLRQLRWLVRWGAWKLSENLGTPKISKMWPFLSIFNRENEMENGDDPLELGIACRQTRVCRFFGHSMTEMPDLQQIQSSSHLVSLAYQEMGINETCVDSCGV